MASEKTIKVSKETYEKIFRISKMEQRAIKTVADRAVELYAKTTHKKRGW